MPQRDCIVFIGSWLTHHASKPIKLYFHSEAYSNHRSKESLSQATFQHSFTTMSFCMGAPGVNSVPAGSDVIDRKGFVVLYSSINHKPINMSCYKINHLCSKLFFPPNCKQDWLQPETKETHFHKKQHIAAFKTPPQTVSSWVNHLEIDRAREVRHLF